MVPHILSWQSRHQCNRFGASFECSVHFVLESQGLNMFPRTGPARHHEARRIDREETVKGKQENTYTLERRSSTRGVARQNRKKSLFNKLKEK